MSEVRKEAVFQFLLGLAAKYEILEKERLYLVNEAQARVATIQSEKADLIAEAQEQLDKLNAMRAVDEEPAYTLQQIRTLIGDKPERFRR
jgi:hypothetical protein